MNDSPLVSLPREIRDQIYSYVLRGIGPTCHISTRCNPSIYIHDFCMKPSPTALKSKAPDVWAITARDHPLLYSCRQLSDEGFDIFLTNNDFVQDILVISLTASACKFLGTFVRGLGKKSTLIRKLGLAIEEPTEESLEKLLGWLIAFGNTERLRSGALVLRMKMKRPTKTPPLFSPFGESWTIAPKDEDMMVLEIVITNGRSSWTQFNKSMDRDWNERQRGTERVLKACRDSGMKGVEERGRAWREERRLWWEETRRTMHAKFEYWLKIMEGLQQRKRFLEDCSAPSQASSGLGC